MVANVRQKQRDVLTKVLNLNASGLPGKDPADLYKVLILDRGSKDIIAPLLRVGDLRKLGVTLHLMLDADRQPIPDVAAVYLVAPTPGNIERIVADAAAGLYEAMHLNFTTSLPSRLMEQLAGGVVRADAAHRITKLHDQFVAFTALEPNLFSLGLPDAYVQLNDPAAQDTQIEAVVSTIVDGLFSVCVSLGAVPVLRCPRGGVAEHVASLLDGRLRDALRGKHNLFSEAAPGLAASPIRPLLALFDRNYDMAGILVHPWTYKPLVHDILGLRLNKVSLTGGDAAGPGSTAGGKKSYELDEADFFWEACGAHIFPKVADEVDTQLKLYRAAVDEINKRMAAGAAEGAYVDADELIRRNTQNLMSAVSSLPELQEKKKTLDKHTNIATALLGAIKARGLEVWHDACEDALAGKADAAAVAKFLAGPKGAPADRLRLALCWLLAAEGLPSDADYGEVEGSLRAAGVDSSALAYVRTLKRNHLVGARAGGEGAGQQPSGPQSGASVFDYVAKLGKMVLAGSRQAPITSALEALMEGKSGAPEFESFAIFDPKVPAGRAGLDRAKGPFRDALVFVIGGGNYMEREALAAWAARGTSAQGGAGGVGVLGPSGGAALGPARHVVYGATELLGGDEFVAQLAELGRRSGLGPGNLVLAAATTSQDGKPPGK